MDGAGRLGASRTRSGGASALRAVSGASTHAGTLRRSIPRRGSWSGRAPARSETHGASRARESPPNAPIYDGPGPFGERLVWLANGEERAVHRGALFFRPRSHSVDPGDRQELFPWRTTQLGYIVDRRQTFPGRSRLGRWRSGNGAARTCLGAARNAPGHRAGPIRSRPNGVYALKWLRLNACAWSRARDAGAGVTVAHDQVGRMDGRQSVRNVDHRAVHGRSQGAKHESLDSRGPHRNVHRVRRPLALSRLWYQPKARAASKKIKEVDRALVHLETRLDDLQSRVSTHRAAHEDQSGPERAAAGDRGLMSPHLMAGQRSPRSSGPASVV